MNKYLAVVVICIGLAGRAAAETNRAPNFFPVERDRRTNQPMVILPFKCTEGTIIEWIEEYQSALNGLDPNTKIKAYSREGNFVSGMLGSPTCFAGECTANYVALPLALDDGLNDVLAISRDAPFVIKAVEIIENEN